MLEGERLKKEYDRKRKAALSPRVPVAGRPVAVAGSLIGVNDRPPVVVAGSSVAVTPRVHCQCINKYTGELCLAKLQRSSAFAPKYPYQQYWSCSRPKPDPKSEKISKVISPIRTLLYIILTQLYLSCSLRDVIFGDY
jgi:hypothetical protein